MNKRPKWVPAPQPNQTPARTTTRGATVQPMPITPRKAPFQKK